MNKVLEKRINVVLLVFMTVLGVLMGCTLETGMHVATPSEDTVPVSERDYFEVTLRYSNGNIYKKLRINKGDVLELATLNQYYPEVADYSFSGWSLTQDNESIVMSDLEVENDLSLYAIAYEVHVGDLVTESGKYISIEYLKGLYDKDPDLTIVDYIERKLYMTNLNEKIVGLVVRLKSDECSTLVAGIRNLNGKWSDSNFSQRKTNDYAVFSGSLNESNTAYTFFNSQMRQKDISSLYGESTVCGNGLWEILQKNEMIDITWYATYRFAKVYGTKIIYMDDGCLMKEGWYAPTPIEALYYVKTIREYNDTYKTILGNEFIFGSQDKFMIWTACFPDSSLSIAEPGSKNTAFVVVYDNTNPKLQKFCQIKYISRQDKAYYLAVREM